MRNATKSPAATATTTSQRRRPCVSASVSSETIDGSGSGVTIVSSVRTSTLTTLAALAAAASVVLLAVAGRKPARPSRREQRADLEGGVIATQPAMAAESTPWWRRLMAAFGMSALAAVWGLVAAIAVAGLIAIGLVLIGHAVR